MSLAPSMPIAVPCTQGRPAKQACPVLVVIVNFRTPDLTIQSLASLAPEVEALPGTRVIVVDNDSADGSADAIQGAIESRGWEPWATLLRTAKNGGFAYGNNRGIEAGLDLYDPAYILLLNSDTIVHPGCLAHCIKVMDADPRIGAMSCCLLNADGSVQNVARRFPTPWRLFAMTVGLPYRFPGLFAGADCEDVSWDRRTTARDVDWLGGAFLFVRADVVRELGGLDERFFFYGEDIEFCHRLWAHGLRVRFDPGATTTHLGGQSSDPTRLASKLRSASMWRARYMVQRLCFGACAAAIVRAVDVSAMAVRYAGSRISPREETRARSGDFRAALVMLLKDVGRA